MSHRLSPRRHRAIADHYRRIHGQTTLHYRRGRQKTNRMSEKTRIIALEHAIDLLHDYEVSDWSTLGVNSVIRVARRFDAFLNQKKDIPEDAEAPRSDDARDSSARGHLEESATLEHQEEAEPE